MTSIKWLINAMENPNKNINWEDAKQQAKEMHKQEIIDAWENGQDSFSSRNAEQYYQETFGSKGSGEVELPQQEISDEEMKKEHPYLVKHKVFI